MKIFSLVLIAIIPFIKNDNSEDVLKAMYNRYAGKWMKSFSFTQTTEQYRNDSLINTATWYENVVYPDKFRIDFGEKEKGNAAIFTKDSVYSFRNSKLARTTPNDDDLTFMLGGMYFYPFETVKATLVKQGYNPDKFYETAINGKPVYVIGANNADEKLKQLWIDKEKLVVIKFISYNNNEKEEGIFSEHKKFGNGWSETNCDFYIDGKLIQKEKYYDCKADANIDLKMFDYKNFMVRK